VLFTAQALSNFSRARVMTAVSYLTAFAADAAAKEPAVFPPLDTWHFPSQIFWTLLSFGLLYFMLSRFILPKLGSTIETRHSTIADNLDEAQRLADEADAGQKALEVRMAEARAKSRETADKARAKIETQINAETAKVDADLATKLDAAEARITHLRDEAMSNVSQIAADATQAITDRFGVKTTTAAASSAVGKALDS
jgi:F-type H+-transporting ATPase subunit b